MQAVALTDLHEAVERRRELEYQLAFVTLESDQVEVKQELRNLQRRIKKLQGNVRGAYPEPFIDCRDIGHSWVKVSEEFNEADVLIRSLSCARCNAFRYDQINAMGDLVRRAYHYEDGYTITEVGSHVSKTFWRGLTYMAARR